MTSVSDKKPESVILYVPPVFAGSAKVPAVVREAERRWARAVEDAQKNNMLAAAAAFVDVAVMLRLAPDADYVEVADAARVSAYGNAVICWLAVDAVDLARRRLTKEAMKDAAAAEALAALPVSG